jgi:UDP-N-acetylmuramoyl-tripeptide--D-alanyl-D-alanine ligase
MGWTYTLKQLAGIIGASTPRTDARFRAVSTDTRALKKGAVFFALSGENFDGNTFVKQAFAKGASAAVTSRRQRGGPCLVVDDPLRALQAFAAHHRAEHPIPLIAITGSCGKTTAKDMIAAVLATRFRVVKTQGNLNNEIGCPLSLLAIDRKTERAIIEMGANHAGEIAGLCAMARPNEAAVTLVAPAHLEGFGTIERVAKAKAEIMVALPETGTFYVNADNPWCVKMGTAFRGNTVTFGTRGDVVLEECRMLRTGEMRLRIAPIGTLRLPLVCRAHATNVLLAVSVGLQHGIDCFEEPLREATAASARMNMYRLGPIEVIDDTYNANPASMAAALETLSERPGKGPRFAALGDMLELGAAAGDLHREVGRVAARLGIDHVFATGEFAGEVVAGALESGAEHAERFGTHEAMAAALHALARRGSKLLAKGSRGMRMERVIEALRQRIESS